MATDSLTAEEKQETTTQLTSKNELYDQNTIPARNESGDIGYREYIQNFKFLREIIIKIALGKQRIHLSIKEWVFLETIPGQC